MERTIAAISTPPGTGGISVIRLSGDEAIKIADSVFTGKLADAASHTIHYGYIEYGGERIDEVLVSVMRAPRTYTAEDTVEISTHGGIIVTGRVLEACIKAGATPAAPGEFTKRAFMNGRIDLTKAEAVIDIINSDNIMAGKNAFGQLQGKLSEKLGNMRQVLVDLAARMQVAIDYPDEELEDITCDEIKDILSEISGKISDLIRSADDGRIIKDGIRTAIVGKPNVGKSTLLNCLAGFDKAIVTDIAGTTRDVIEENISINGVPIKLIDTAGIRDTEDVIEKIGVEKSKQVIEDADLVIVVVNAHEPLSEEDSEVLEKVCDKKSIIVANKTDIGTDESIVKLNPVFISAGTGVGTELVGNRISELYNIGEIKSRSGEIITNMRHKSALCNCLTSVETAIKTISDGLPQDLAALDIYDAINYLGEITGETVSEDIVSSVFKNFCVGK